MNKIRHFIKNNNSLRINNLFKFFSKKKFYNIAIITSILLIKFSGKFYSKITILLIIFNVLRNYANYEKFFLNKNLNEDDSDKDIIDENSNNHELNENLRNNNKEDNNNKFKYIKTNINDKDLHNKTIIEKNYKNEDNLNEFILNVNSNTCSTPIFNLRKYCNMDYYHNFILHNFDPQKINNLIMCKDIHKWMSETSLSDEDLQDEIIPIFYIKKKDDKINVYEYLRIFIHTNEDEIRNALVQKGIDYLNIENDINELIQKGFIKDLLSSKEYINYNLSSRDGICSFLDKFLSHVLIPEQSIGDIVHLDIDNYLDNKQTFEYHLNTVNADLCGFDTTI
jgi:hypothetical protein